MRNKKKQNFRQNKAKSRIANVTFMPPYITENETIFSSKNKSISKMFGHGKRGCFVIINIVLFIFISIFNDMFLLDRFSLCLSSFLFYCCCCCFFFFWKKNNNKKTNKKIPIKLAITFMHIKGLI